MANTYQAYGTCALESCNIQNDLHPKVVQFAKTRQGRCSSRHLVVNALFGAERAYEPYDLAAVSPKTSSEKFRCFLAAGIPIAFMFLGILAPAFM